MPTSFAQSLCRCVYRDVDCLDSQCPSVQNSGVRSQHMFPTWLGGINDKCLHLLVQGKGMSILPGVPDVVPKPSKERN